MNIDHTLNGNGKGTPGEKEDNTLKGSEAGLNTTGEKRRSTKRRSLMKELEQKIVQSVTTSSTSSMKNDGTLKGNKKGPEKSDEKMDEEHEATRRDDLLKGIENDPAMTGEKKDEDPDETAIPTSTGLPPLPPYSNFDEAQSSDEEGESEEQNANPIQESLNIKATHLVLEKHRATKRASTRKRHEMRIQELEQEVERLSLQIKSLQEKNDGLRIHMASLDSSLRRAKNTVDVTSSRAVYIIQRFHQMYREKLEQHVAGENHDGIHVAAAEQGPSLLRQLSEHKLYNFIT
jgi:hypothetical protein